MEIASFAAGFASGWVVRGTVESSRGLVVELGVRALGLRGLLSRAIATEREFFEDLWAEIQSRAHMSGEPEAEEATVRPQPARANGGSHERYQPHA